MAAQVEVMFFSEGGMVQQPFSGMRASFTSTNGLVACIICFPQAAKLTKGDVLKGAVGVMPTIDPDSLMLGRQFNVNMGGIVIGIGIVTGETVLVGRSFSDVQALADLMAEQRERDDQNHCPEFADSWER